MIKYLRTQKGGLGGELILMALSSFQPPTCCLARSAGSPDPDPRGARRPEEIARAPAPVAIATAVRGSETCGVFFLRP